MEAKLFWGGEDVGLAGVRCGAGGLGQKVGLGWAGVVEEGHPRELPFECSGRNRYCWIRGRDE
jgi:hypothetical protein